MIDMLDLQNTMLGYIAGKNEGSTVVSAINDFVSSDCVSALQQNIVDEIFRLQDEVAFYVPSSSARTEYTGYFGDEKLTAIIKAFVAKHPL